MISRHGIYVFYHKNRVKQELKKFGNIIFESRKIKYYFMYINRDKYDQLVGEIKKLKGVKRVLDSNVDYTPFDFEE